MKRQVIIGWTLVKVTIVVILVGWGALYLRTWDPYLGISLPSWTRMPAWIFLISGGFLVFVSGGILSTRGITPQSRFLPNEFVAFGPFRYLRNPMSLGVTILMFGLALYESSASICLFALTLFLFLHVIVVYMEEPSLERRFGDSYRAYKQSVNRWVPRFGDNKS